MSEPTAWFEGLDPDDREGAMERISAGSAPAPRRWPDRAVTSGWAPDEATYYERLHDATLEAAETGADERERAVDRQVIEAIRTVDHLDRLANELAERLTEWASGRYGEELTGMEGLEMIADRDPTDAFDERLCTLASRTLALREEAEALRTLLEREIPVVAPNLSALAGPLLAARLLAHAGSLESLAKQPSGTIQVMGAEDALFAHLRGSAPSPKHGTIFTHPAIRTMPADKRGAAARALAGKLAIAARIDHYAGDYRPTLETELEERLATIRTRGSSDA